MDWTRATAGALMLGLAACAPAPEAPTAGAGRADAGAGGFGAVVPMPEPVVVAGEAAPAPAAPAPAAPVSAAPGGPAPRAGVLTAGDIDDTLNLGAFDRYLARARRDTRLPAIDFGAPVLARLIGPDGAPAPHQRVTLRRPGADEPFWDGFSGVDGRIAAFPAALGAGRLREVELRAFPPDQGEPVAQTVPAGIDTAVRVPFGPAVPGFLDLVLVLDVTGSMGDELAFLTRDLDAIVAEAGRGAPGLDVRTGLVVYRDEGDAFTVRAYDLAGGRGAMRALLSQQVADGGGDYPEAAADAMAAALGLSWRRGQGERILLHVADAPPHDPDARAYLDRAGDAAARGIHVYALGASGVGPESQMLMRQAAALTQGRYLFLTDDSGVGLAHDEPAVSCYLVTELRGLLARVLRSAVEGRRVEPPPAEVLREVGTYQAGVCRD